MEQSAGQRSSVATNATVDLEVLDCTVCCHPLKPPVLQVQEGKRVLRDVDGGHLFLVDVAPAGPAGLAGAVLLLDPHAGAKAKPKFECHVAFHCRATGWRSSSEFPVRSTALDGGSLPADCYAFVVPRVAHPPATASIIVSVYDVSKKRPRNGDIRQHLKSRVN
ncbi:Os01g0761900 [Oryza sativa Japonica Group]|uniref:Os01g0761900 protein n=1 Tax=Oryza sativa subsp. japonica TaxID=39947 RepID=A0A0P0V8L3_ORYSJ|nr:Os01g0761900 [Oryza sativa Japonica Group]